jgi:hypothetical protein
MKKLTLLPLLLFAAFFSLTACRDEFSDMASIKRMEDTLFKTYPTMAGVSVEVNEHHELNVVVRSAQLYSTDGENQQKVASEIGAMAQNVFGTNNELDKGQVTFTKDERSTDMKPADGKTFPISFSKQ